MTTLADLRRQNVEEQRASNPETPTTSAHNEEMKVPSFEGRLEGTKERAHVQSRTPSKAGTREGREVRTKVSAKLPAPVPMNVDSDEEWLAGVLKRAREGGNDVKGVMTRLNVDIDEELHLRLKSHCLKNRTTLRKLVPLLMEAYLEKVGD